MAVEVNLYPPLIDSFMPAFIHTSTCRVYFSLSDFNSMDNIAHAQVVLKNQVTNKNMLKPMVWANGIKIAQIHRDDAREGHDKYYIEISPSEVLGDVFQIGQNYKVQIRLSKIEVPEEEREREGGPSAYFFSTNTKYFSEWSTVCLIRGIYQPEFTILDLNEDKIGSNMQSLTIIGHTSTFVGTYHNDEPSELLKTWRLRVYAAEDTDRLNALTDSGIITVNSYDFKESITYTFPYLFEVGARYTLVVDIVTKNLYSESKNFTFSMISYNEYALEGYLSAKMNEDEGYCEVNLRPRSTNIGELMYCNVTIRRTSSESNFSIWEDVYNYTFINETLNLTWRDFTVKSGVFYQYAAQQRDNKGRRGIIIKTPEQVHGIFDDSFLVNGYKDNDGVWRCRQLKLRFDPNISSYQTVVSENKTDTIGGKYPFIKRNGNTYYRQFNISGLISHYCDEAGLFATENDIYKFIPVKDLYKRTNDEKNIIKHNDYIYEREFRQQVENFLYDDSVKLFKSTTEGNILVKLMGITLTPVTTLGRMLYSFNATAYEVAEPSLEKCDYHNIQKIGTYDTEISFSTTNIGQFMGALTANENVMDLIKQKHHYGETVRGVKIDKITLRHLRIEVNSKPYLIVVEADGSMRPLGDLEPTTGREILGTIVIIDGQQIFIGPSGIYEMKGDGVNVQSEIIVLKDCDLTIDYACAFDKKLDSAQIASTIYYSTTNGQLFKAFNPEEDIITEIYYKYYKNYQVYYQKALAVNTVNIEANPGSVLYAKDSSSDNYIRLVVGFTGELFLDPGDNAVINNLYFIGSHWDAHPKMEFEEFKATLEVVSTLGAVKNPAPYNCYIYNDLVYIYYRNTWYVLDNKFDIHCDIDAIVNYYAEISKGVY